MSFHIPCCLACLCWHHFSAAPKLPRHCLQPRPSEEQIYLQRERKQRELISTQHLSTLKDLKGLWILMFIKRYLPESSVALASAWQLISSSTMPSTANRAERISGVVPSCIRASRSVARFRIKICTNKDLFS